jgi:hypothetical protein
VRLIISARKPFSLPSDGQSMIHRVSTALSPPPLIFTPLIKWKASEFNNGLFASDGVEGGARRASTFRSPIAILIIKNIFQTTIRFLISKKLDPC